MIAFYIVIFLLEKLEIQPEGNKITVIEIYKWIGAIIVGAALIWHTIVYDRRVKVQERQTEILAKRIKDQEKQTEFLGEQVKNEETANLNKQFLDSVKIFESSTATLETKKGALYHLENLALSSPNHRQRVMDFLNSLNQWMRDKSDTLKSIDEKKMGEMEK